MSYTADDQVKFFTRGSRELTALYRQIREPVQGTLQNFCDAVDKISNVDEKELWELKTRLEINREVNKVELIDLRDEVGDKFMACTNKVALKTQLTRITGGQVSKIDTLGEGRSKEVREFVRGLSIHDLRDLDSVLDLANRG